METYKEAALAGIVALVVAFIIAGLGFGGFASLALVVSFALFGGALVHRLEMDKEKKAYTAAKIESDW